MQAFVSQYVFDGTKLLKNKAVLVDNGIIVDIVDANTIMDKELIINYGDGVLSAGFIDLQLNGCGGVLFNEDLSHNTLDTMYKTCLRYGTTSFLPTLITSDFSDVIKALEVVKQWFKQYGNSKGVLGIHLEGPFISKAKAGIHPQNFILKPDLQLLQQIVDYRKFFPVKMTIAVEEFNPQQIQFLKDNGVILSVGHSNAKYAEVISAIEHGVVTATHVFNAMSGLTARGPGVIGAVLNSNIYMGLIADLLHVDSANIEIIHKIKADKIYLVTDAVTPTGTNIEEFKLAGKTLYVKQGKCLDELGILGGAYLTMNEAIQNCVTHCNIDLVSALKMASSIPAKVMQLSESLGVIKPGYRADIIHLNLDTFNCQPCNTSS